MFPKPQKPKKSSFVHILQQRQKNFNLDCNNATKSRMHEYNPLKDKYMKYLMPSAVVHYVRKQKEKQREREKEREKERERDKGKFRDKENLQQRQGQEKTVDQSQFRSFLIEEREKILKKKMGGQGEGNRQIETQMQRSLNMDLSVNMNMSMSIDAERDLNKSQIKQSQKEAYQNNQNCNKKNEIIL